MQQYSKLTALCSSNRRRTVARPNRQILTKIKTNVNIGSVLLRAFNTQRIWPRPPWITTRERGMRRLGNLIEILHQPTKSNKKKIIFSRRIVSCRYLWNKMKYNFISIFISRFFFGFLFFSTGRWMWSLSVLSLSFRQLVQRQQWHTEWILFHTK